MWNYLFKILITVIFSIVIAFFYYSVYPGHIENFNWYIWYLIPLFLVYGTYKYLNKDKKEVEFSLYWILWYFLLNLFILSIFFFWINDVSIINWEWKYWAATGITLFFKIMILSIFPIILTYINIAFGRKISKNIWILKEDREEWIYNFLLSLGLWFFSFLFLVSIFGFVGLYNFYVVFIILLWFSIFSLKEIWELWEWFINYRVSFKNHNLSDSSLIKNIAPKLLSTEFLFIVWSIILAVNLISIVRPMPIGWDDLWVYMNYPRQMANAGTLDFLGGMYAWQVLTGIWYMIYEPTQAFFLNNLGWFLSFIVIILITSDLLKQEKYKTLINIPLLLSVVFISMPMVVFQQAKDMKLDEWLFFISAIVLYLIIKFFNKDFIIKKKNILLLVIWILAWFAFSIKITSLLLISGIIWIIFYSKLGFSGFLGYIWIYGSLFTKAWLWSYLNIVYDRTNVLFINYISWVFFVLWITFLISSILKNKENFIKLIKYVWIFLLWFIIAILPWIWKNIEQVKQADAKITIWSLLWGHTKSFVANYRKIYSKQELEIIENKDTNVWLNSSWTTTNEDWWRYFGYEKWINNYVKLPWNLTMQVNQGWEFTTLTWLFLALLPILFLFLKYKRRGLEYLILLFILAEILLFIIPSSREFLTHILTQINLPFGYLILFLISFIPLLFLLFSLKNNEKNNLFKVVLVFNFIYILLFSVSAYWVVWYWIVMYYSLLLLMWISLYELTKYKNDDSEKKKDIKLFWSFIIFSMILSYFFLSVFPHSFNNLKNAGYPHFKAWKFTAIEWVFAYHPEYKSILFNLNIDKNKLKQWQAEINLKQVLNPSKNISDESIVYRAWTFLKYFINWNNYRLMEDSLLTNFNKYFYDKADLNKSIERLKKMWVKYLLIDLNAATIDNDPRRALTKRYENILKTFTSDKLQLIETDSVCLKVALEDYKKSKKTIEDLNNYMLIAWVNYNWYDKQWKVIPKQKKLKICESRVLDLVRNNKVDSKNYSYLKWIKSLNHGWKVLFEIK